MSPIFPVTVMGVFGIAHSGLAFDRTHLTEYFSWADTLGHPFFYSFWKNQLAVFFPDMQLMHMPFSVLESQKQWYLAEIITTVSALGTIGITGDALILDTIESGFVTNTTMICLFRELSLPVTTPSRTFYHQNQNGLFAVAVQGWWGILGFCGSAYTLHCPANGFIAGTIMLFLVGQSPISNVWPKVTIEMRLWVTNSRELE